MSDSTVSNSESPSSAAPAAIDLNSKRTGVAKQFAQSYLNAIIAGQHIAASQVIDQALAAGITAKNVYLHILVAAQRALGDLWMDGTITVAQEHIATQITISEMGRLRTRLQPLPQHGKRALVTAVQGDPHALGGRIVADFLFLDGWRVDYLGADIPTSELVRFISEHTVDLVALSITLSPAIEVAGEVVKEIRKYSQNTKILVGGFALTASPQACATLGADATAEDAGKVAEIARATIGLPPSSSSLVQYQIELGKRIQSRRKAQALSQHEVAQAAGLDRAYLSAIENGKHNVTLGAVMKIAEALDVQFHELLMPQGIIP